MYVHGRVCCLYIIFFNDQILIFVIKSLQVVRIKLECFSAIGACYVGVLKKKNLVMMTLAKSNYYGLNNI